MTIPALSPFFIGKYSVEAENIYGIVKTSCQIMILTENESDDTKRKTISTEKQDLKNESKKMNLKIVKKGIPPTFIVGLSDMDLKDGDTAAVSGKLAKKRKEKFETDDPKSLKESIISTNLKIDENYEENNFIGLLSPLSPNYKNINETTLDDIRHYITSRNKKICPPKFIVKPKLKKLIQEFKSLRLKIAISGNPNPEIIWDFNGIILEIGNKYSIYNDGDFYFLEIHHFSFYDQGFYNCTATNIFGIATVTSEINLEENISSIEKFKKLQYHHKNLAPKFIENLPEKIITKNGTNLIIINCSIKSYPMSKISWLKNDVKILPQKNKFSIFFDGESSTLKIFNIILEDSGKYFFVAENSYGKIENSLDLIVETINFQEQIPPKFANSKQKIKKNAEEKIIQLKTEIIQGSEPIKIKWLFNKMEINENMNLKCLKNENNAILEIHDAFPEDSGEYICLAENDFGKAKCCIHLIVTGWLRWYINWEKGLPKVDGGLKQ